MIGLYLRLSSADGDLGTDGKDESNSIENQRAMLHDFVEHRDDMTDEVVEYIDDGYSGTNFDRPAFRELMEDMKSGKINVLITKDLSRLGRNYIEVGDYMEQIFPLLGVRYIAINSSYDSNDYIGNTIGLEMSVMNLVNTLYSKDLSKKVKSGVEAKWKSGKSTSSRPAFGYQRDPEDKSQWIIEPVAAAIVRRIFDMALEGSTSRDIVDALNADKVMTPGKYREQYGFVKRTNRKVKDEEWLWEYRMVWKILRTYEYTGALVQGKISLLTVGSKKTRTTSQDERIIYEGHHEAIVTHDEYEKARLVIRKQKHSGAINHDDYPLGPVLYCGNCGLRMHHPDTLDRYVVCKHKDAAGAHSKCTDTRYPTDKIDFCVRKSLRNQLLQMEQLADKMKRQSVRKVRTSETIKSIETKIKSLKADKTALYESFAEDRLDRAQYLKRRSQLQGKVEAMEREKEHLKDMTAISDNLSQEADQYMKLAKELYSTSELSAPVVDAFIERVTIYDAEHIDIKFKFGDLIKQIIEESNRLEHESIPEEGEYA